MAPPGRHSDADAAEERRPLIGITGTLCEAGRLYPRRVPALAGLSLEAFFANYGEHLFSVCATPVMLSRAADPTSLVTRLDGLVIAGGSDINPSFYGGPPGAADTDPARDSFESSLVIAALGVGLPILGTCRGAQLLNVTLGGSLVADLGSEDHGGLLDHDRAQRPAGERAHEVAFATGSALNGLLGDTASVSSLHHQAVDRLGKGLSATGHSRDGSIEAIELLGGAAIGVQWHPEFHPHPDPVFSWLADEAREFRARTPVEAGR